MRRVPQPSSRRTSQLAHLVHDCLKGQWIVRESAQKETIRGTRQRRKQTKAGAPSVDNREVADARLRTDPGPQYLDYSSDVLDACRLSPVFSEEWLRTSVAPRHR